MAQSVTNLDGDTSADGKQRTLENTIVREVERGMYLKANLGSNSYIGTYSGLIRPVIAVNLGIGSDFVDNENMSLAWEFQFAQALHNGPKLDELPGLTGGPLVQGDIHTLSGIVTLEASFYPSSRLGIGLRAGGGMMFVPVLVEASAYETEIVAGAWGGTAPALHDGPMPMVAGGPTLEYYTKLSHFSVGVDVDVYYVIGFDIALAPTGYLKYTF
jgi:hypothetical protein